jgi:hypothetical protein
MSAVGVWGGQAGIEKEFGSCEARHFGASVAWVVNSVAAHGEADSTWLFFGGTVSNNKAKVSGLASLLDLTDMYVVHGSCARFLLVSICQVSHLFGAGFAPEGAVGALQELWVLDGLAGVGMDGAKCLVVLGDGLVGVVEPLLAGSTNGDSGRIPGARGEAGCCVGA